jgi:hypothetical protein
MNTHSRECIERATECVRLAEIENNDGVMLFLMNLASAWARAAAQAQAKNIQDVIQPTA